MRKANIVLVGFMGTGKSSVGQVIAGELHWQFVDMDTLIVERQGKPIPRIFAEDGEPHFRALERALVQELAAGEGLVISTGGGIVLNPKNIEDFDATGLVVCLRARPETILDRVGQDTNRPLLAVEDKLGKIRQLLEARSKLYDAIGCQVDTDGLTPHQIANVIIGTYEFSCL